MKRAEKIKFIFSSTKNILASYQVGQLYEKQMGIIFDYLFCLSNLVSGKKEKQIFMEEVEKIKDYFQAFASEATFSLFEELINKEPSGENIYFRKMFNKFFNSCFLDTIKSISEELDFLIKKEKELKENLFFEKPSIELSL